MSSEAEKLGLYLEDSSETKFKTWREKMNGPSDSNMTKIADAIAGKQDKLTGAKGQVVGFTATGTPVAQGTDELVGPAGASAGFGTPSATVDANVGTPSVTVTTSGPDTAKVFDFAFKNLKGATGEKGETGDDGTPGADGKSAYQYAVDGGYTGTEEEFQALMGTGPWLPLSGGTMKGTLQVGSPSKDCKFLFDGHADGEPITMPPQPLSGKQMTLSVSSERISVDYVGTPVVYNSPRFQLSAGRPLFIFTSVQIPYDYEVFVYRNPTSGKHAANKKYVDDSIAAINATIGDISALLDEINGEVV